MFDYDKWQEIFGTIKRNKLRTFLTIFGIGWGIFMIVILLGAGNGLQNGVTRDFNGWATNSGFFWTRRTTISHDGLLPGRYIRFTNEDTKMLREKVPEIKYLSPRNSLGGFRGGARVVKEDKAGSFSVFGDTPDYINIQQVIISSGRFLNVKDLSDERKVAVIGQNVVDVLFDEEEDPIGQYLKINNVSFQVVGVFQSQRSGEQAERDTQTIFTPFTTFQKAFQFGNRVSWFGYSAEEGYKVSEVEEKIVAMLKEQHHIHPDDADAIGTENLEEEFGEINGLFTGMNIFTWFVGISTLFAGIIGVSNIMLIIVKERTKEIGIRKSLGATPYSIVSLIVQESIFLTTIAGYLALVVGIFLLEAIGKAIPDDGFLLNPEVSMPVAIGALLILIIGGAIAGILPASKAVSINPIEAIRQD